MSGDDRQVRFAEIYDAYSGLILAYAAARTNDRADAADIVAETFTVAWRRLDDVPAGEQARPWLYGVARNVLRNHNRSRHRRRRLDRRVAAEISAVVEPTFMSDAPDQEAIHRAFASLRERDRELLTLVGWEQLGRDEIATVLGVDRSAIRVRLHRARNRFEAALAAEGVKRMTSSGHGPSRWATALPDSEDPR